MGSLGRWDRAHKFRVNLLALPYCVVIKDLAPHAITGLGQSEVRVAFVIDA